MSFRTIALALSLAIPPLTPAVSQIPIAGSDSVRELPVALVADSIEFDENTQTVTAIGSVEVYQGTRVLTASAITYNSQSGEIAAQGPIVLRDPSGSTIIADMATVDAELRNGLVSGARAIIGNNQGTLAAREGQRIEGRYFAMSRVVYSSCDVCRDSSTPTWQIRARRVVHDEVERMVYYEGAIFDFFGVPIAYLPFFSHPDPTVERKSGVLVPSFLQSTIYGFAVKAPYFINLGPSRDATITPFLTTKDGPIILGEYRQVFESGAVFFEGSGAAVSTGANDATQARGHLFGRGSFDVSESIGRFLGLGDDTIAGFSLQLTSDDTYLDRYDLSNFDRLESDVFVNKFGSDGFFRADSTYFRSLRENEVDSSEMAAIPYLEGRQTISLGERYGDLGLSAGGVFLTRPDGRDTGRFSLGMDWKANTVLPYGFKAVGSAEIKVDAYSISGDSILSNNTAHRIFPQVGLELRYPLIASFFGTYHLIEPGIQIISSASSSSKDIPNEDSTIVQYDATNIFSKTRFPGYDRVETGTRINFGLNQTSVINEKMTLNTRIGQVYHLNSNSDAAGAFSFDRRFSDIVASFDLALDESLLISNSVRLSNDFRATEAVLSIAYESDVLRLRTNYAFFDQEQASGFERDLEELSGDVSVAITRNWTVGASWRQDLARAEVVDLGASVAYQNECTALQLGVMQDYPNRSGADREVTVSLRVQLLGRSDPTRRGRGSCSNMAHRTN